MKKPILFNTEMVRAILEGRKTVTRRVIKPRYRKNEYGWSVCRRTIDNSIAYLTYTDEDGASVRTLEPPYQVGDVLYVRETWRKEDNGFAYYATDRHKFGDEYVKSFKWKPSIHMPKEAARIWLKVTDVRVERLQDITPKQAGQEGVQWETDNSGLYRRFQFHKLWDSTIKKQDLDKYGWNANPWVWVIEFERNVKDAGSD